MFHGKRGELRQRYREGQEDQLGALGLVLNVIVLWNTIYIEAALEQLRQGAQPVLERPCDNWQTLFLYCSLCRRRKARNGLDPCRILVGCCMGENRGSLFVKAPEPSRLWKALDNI